MEHYKEGQYDDDLTVGIDEYDEDFDTGGVDLFDYISDEESPLSRLKSIILSIDWEITDDILRQFNEELRDLQDIWAGNKINLIYVQALEKISRYIYKEKSSSHPTAIKLLLTFYANLEKIVSEEGMTDREKKNLLRSDIEKFEKLKSQIIAASHEVSAVPTSEPEPLLQQTEVEESQTVIDDDFDDTAVSDAIIPPSDEVFGEAGDEDPLLNLKAIVYGIDWEITERDLDNLSREVKRLEQEFITSRVKQIFLQGIGSLGAYINLKRSNAHADAFKLLHSFFVGLEKVVREDLSRQDEKNVLLPEVEKFNAFKSIIADTLVSDGAGRSGHDEDEFTEPYDEIQPAFSDVPEDVHGFQEESEVDSYDGEDSDTAVDEYFDEDESETVGEESDHELADEMESRLDGMFDEPGKEEVLSLDPEVALKGVNVESEADDDSDEEPLRQEDGEFAPALAGDEPLDEASPAVFTEQVEEFFKEPEEDAIDLETEEIPGVDVEHVADDDSEEEPLPFEGDEYAPALSRAEDDEEEDTQGGGERDESLDTLFQESSDEQPAGEIEAAGDKENVEGSEDIENRLTDFFGESEPEIVDEQTEDVLQGVDVETPEDDDSLEQPLPFENGEIAPALTMDEPEEIEEEQLSENESDHIEVIPEETEVVEDRFDELFGEEDAAEILEDQEDEEFAVPPVEMIAEVEESIESPRGVDVETEDDDDSEEAPLPFEEDGEISPALAEDDSYSVEEADDEDLDKEDDAAELEVGDRFDSFFGEEDQEEPSLDEFAAQKEEEEASLEELVAQEEPEAPAVEEPVTEEDDSDDDVPELYADDVDSVFADLDGAVETAGEVPSGYPSADELLQEFGEIAGEDGMGDITHPEGDEAFIIGVRRADEFFDEEEEVIFEPVDDDEEGAIEAQSATQADEQGATFEPSDQLTDRGEFDEVDFGDEYDDSSYFGTTLLSDKPQVSATPQARREPEDEPFAPFSDKDEDQQSAYVEPLSHKPDQDALADLRNCIVSLGLEIDDSILGSLNDEIEKLRLTWLNRPAEKTFVQLLSTISSHIERYRYEADAEANKLLLSVFDKLELSAFGTADSSEIQEAILNETSKVLQWQTRLIDRTPAGREEGGKETEQSLAAKQLDKTEDKLSNGLDDMYKKVDEIGNDMLMQKVSSVMKVEMEQLKSAFQAELKELREEIMRRNSRD